VVDDAFLTLHREMTRQGPGTSEDVRWALSQLDLPDAPHVLDAACGPGADLITLAEALPRARIEGIDQLPHLVEEARAATARFTNVTVSTGDMARINGFYDLIWCAGALYFLGVTEGLTLWKRALRADGAVAFSEPVLAAGTPQAAHDFWADYPAISDLDGITARVDAAGYEVLNHRLVTGTAWADYYAELGGRIATLRPGADAALSRVLDDAAREIALWRQAPGDIAYALILARPGFGAI
jgi:trans-aconitate methyltransferase